MNGREEALFACAKLQTSPSIVRGFGWYQNGDGELGTSKGKGKIKNGKKRWRVGKDVTDRELISLISKTVHHFVHASHFFLCRHCTTRDYDVKFPYATFYRGRKHRRTNFTYYTTEILIQITFQASLNLYNNDVFVLASPSSSLRPGLKELRHEIQPN